MATVTSYTAARMKAIEDAAIIDGIVIGNNLWLTRNDGVQIDAGNVRGAQGPVGSTGDTAILVVTSITRPSNPYEGSVIYETDTKRIYSWNGLSWVYRGGTIICTSITRPNVPFAGLAIYETDTLRSYVWNGTAWSYSGGIVICTSTTRPASPFAGLTIFETNTLKSYTWSGSIWLDNNPKALSCKVYRTATQGIGNNVISNIIWTNESWDNGGFWTPGGTAHQLIIPVGTIPGPFRLTLNYQWSINAYGIRVVGILHNNINNLAVHTDMPSGAWYTGTSLNADVMCNPGDNFIAYGYHSAGTVINIDPTSGYPVSFSIAQII